MAVSIETLMAATEGIDARSMLDGRATDKVYRSWFGDRKDIAIDQITQFNRIWHPLRENLQLPVMEKEAQLCGFTGHRQVTFETSIGRCAIGFQLIEDTGGEGDYRAVIASRRKIYAQSRRRVNYTADEFPLSLRRMIENYPSPTMQHQLGVMAVWVEKFLAAEPYTE